ncbi:hypothetical protein BAUCODRAFT_306074 [Baudoinia panamericana UAMH 10762]|uniref:Uncharacterized protein n=1 Tax=Baudoinia panamericana (strain UAMH 10762) TaxID=717646 RepID=M2LCW8_BAUPA|nr:uncharacterized protein BAUCODRAFT_306074 [Baudoinia panamericana UAMH 10762]EMC91822.1 hypothetical protein BAUCODRAFT_306074 [Baudoinia panamericana UAMH 10762]
MLPGLQENRQLAERRKFANVYTLCSRSTSDIRNSRDCVENNLRHCTDRRRVVLGNAHYNQGVSPTLSLFSQAIRRVRHTSSTNNATPKLQRRKLRPPASHRHEQPTRDQPRDQRPPIDRPVILQRAYKLEAVDGNESEGCHRLSSEPYNERLG